ncbi:hypothetical protein ACFV1T_31040, partial [Streptomyces vinaceus]
MTGQSRRSFLTYLVAAPTLALVTPAPGAAHAPPPPHPRPNKPPRAWVKRALHPPPRAPRARRSVEDMRLRLLLDT